MIESLIIDASVAIKWVVEEPGSLQALSLRRTYSLIAPELIIAECANILWKKSKRGESTLEEASLAARLLQRSGISLLGMANLMQPATDLDITLNHPAYDCIYLAAAEATGYRFVTADRRLIRSIADIGLPGMLTRCIDLESLGTA